MIVGTAGHIDHGKTTLVRALTGVDTDRPPQETERGVGIELGCACSDFGAAAPGAARRPGPLGFVDVPGHERLVHTMLAGATGIDFALLLVAADDGVMPQTREHLAVLSLLGIGRGAVVVTKTDRVDAARVAAVRAEAAALVEGTPLAGAPVLPVCAPTGEGLDALRELLRAEAGRGVARGCGGLGFRLAIDRAFSLPGIGTVVTGTAHAGRVQVGDELALVPGRRMTRVRSLHVHNSDATSGAAGQRIALGLGGLAKDEIERGQWLCSPAVALATDRIDARLTLWQGESEPLRQGTPVHLHLGAAHSLASVALLDGDRLAPGASARVQLVLQRPVAAWHGDRVVLRDASASRTLAGGTVLDPLAPARYRRTPQRLAVLDALERAEAAARLHGLVEASPLGVDLQAWSRAEGRRAEVPALPAGSLRASGPYGDLALGAAHVQALAAALLDGLAAFHARQPDEPGPDAARARRLTAPRLPEPLWQALVASLRADGRIEQHGALLHLPAHGVRLSGTEERIAQKVAPLLAGGGFDPPWVRDLARDAQESEALMRGTLARLAQRGELHQVVKDLFYPPATVARLAALVRQLAARDGEVKAAAFRDAAGLGRKRAVQILEYFDRVGLLRRVQDAHRLRGDSTLFAE